MVSSIFPYKVAHAKEIICKAINDYPKIGAACSFGKDSLVSAHLAREVDPKIPIFSVMTIYKPRETFEYLVNMNKIMGLNAKVYLVADEIPKIFLENDIDVVLLPSNSFKERSAGLEKNASLYETAPDECCKLLKVDAIKEAVKGLEAWITGLRATEGKTRENYLEIELRDGIAKVNPLLNFTELDIWKYLAINSIKPHPLYANGYRSLGCQPCTNLIEDDEPERAGRWKGTKKCGGECGIHTQALK